MVILLRNNSIIFNFICRDLEKPSLPVYSTQAHKEIINGIDGVGGLGIGEGAPELVTCSRDGMILFRRRFHLRTLLTFNVLVWTSSLGFSENTVDFLQKKLLFA